MTIDEQNLIEKQNIERSKLRAEIDNLATLKECFLKQTQEACSANIINAHSLQRMGALSRLESNINGNQVLFTLTERQINKLSGKVEFKPVGKKIASTFFGFCGSHDSKIFEPIEQNPESINLESDEHCFLLSFRSFAISYHRKKEEINLLSNSNEEIRNKIKKLYGTNNLNPLLEGAKMALTDMEPYKELLIQSLYSEDYSCLDFFTYELNHASPVAMCMLTTPPFLFSGEPINISTDPNYKYSDILTTVIPLNSKTLIVLASFKDNPNGSKYLDELYEMKDLPLERALTWHILTNSENCFFSPNWFNKLEINQKDFIIGLSDFSGNVNTPHLKFNPKKFKLNFFDKRYSI